MASMQNQMLTEFQQGQTRSDSRADDYHDFFLFHRMLYSSSQCFLREIGVFCKFIANSSQRLVTFVQKLNCTINQRILNWKNWRPGIQMKSWLPFFQESTNGGIQKNFRTKLTGTY
jgi:type IV secretory pathway VirB6-like protein